MTSISTIGQNPAAIRPPSAALAAPSPAMPAMGATIDPFRLLNKYKFVLAGAALLGAVVGAGSHYLLRTLYPVWTPAAQFQCSGTTDKVSDLTTPSGQEEISRFMQTQVRIMTSDEVMRRVSEDPALQKNAPKWQAQFVKNGSFVPEEAAKELRDAVKARVLAGTTLIELSMNYRDKYDATAIVGLVRVKYLDLINSASRVQLEERITALRTRMQEIDRGLGALANSKEQLISNKNVDSIDNRIETTRTMLAETGSKLIEIQQGIDAQTSALKGMQDEIANPAGIAYGDELKEEVERNMTILDLKRDLQSAENALQWLLESGIKPEHRQYVNLQAQIRGIRQNLEVKRGEELRKAFDGRLDTTRKNIDSLQAQRETLNQRSGELQARMTDLTRTQSQIKDIESKMNSDIQARAKLNEDLQQLIAQAQVGTTVSRVVLTQAERPPLLMTFPQLKLLLPGGMALFLGLTAGVILLVEIVDQRVKGPSDIQIIPRTRLVGWVPDAADDPSGEGAVETAFRDRPRGILAESYRQVRAAITKRMHHADHRTLLVAAGMPASGATSVASNLALAFAAADKKVLLIDANFRRPALHRVFGVQEGPGLADVLAKTTDLAQAVQAASTPNLDILAAGSKDQRVFERLASEAIGEVFAKVRAMYDIVIIDVAPAIVAGDALALAQRADATVLVVRALADKRGMVARIKNELSETKSEMLGIVVNGVRAASGGYMKRNIRTAHEYQSS